MVPPNVKGKIHRIHEGGMYNVRETILELENEGNENKPLPVSMSHYWPVRSPRPCLEKLRADTPLLTG